MNKLADLKGEIQISTTDGNLKLPFGITRLSPYGSSNVEIASVDLDHDGKNEILLSWLTAVSNGIGQEYRTLVVIKNGKEMLRYDSGAFTACDAAIKVKDQCHLSSVNRIQTGMC